MATNEAHDAASQLVGLYRTGITSADRLVKTTVGRQHLLDDILGKLRGMRRSTQHSVFIGPRGIGKTHLLSLIECAVESEPTLAGRYTIVRFSEESNRVVSFADLLLGIVEILGASPDGKAWFDLYERVKREEDDDTVVDTILPAIKKWHKSTHRRLLIMLENLDAIFTQKIKNPRCVHQFRSFLMDNPAAVLIGTAPSFFPGLTDIKHPLYDFFDIQVIEDLDEANTIELIRASLAYDHRADLLAGFDDLVPKIRALHYMTGGNPRLILILYGLIARENVLDVKAQFRKLLDGITPFYQDRLKDLAPHERALLETMALMRTSYDPKTPVNIARSMRKPQQQVSVLLKRMLKAGYLSVAGNPEDKRSRLYRIKEGFFDLWLAMNESRTQRARLPFLVEFFERWYSQPAERERKRGELHTAYSSPTAIAPQEARENVAEGIEQWAHASAAPDVRQQIAHMIEYWHTQRAGDFETAARLAQKLAYDFSEKGLHELNIELMDNALAHVQDQNERSELLVLRGRSQQALGRMKEALVSLGTAVESCRASKNLPAEGRALNDLALVLRKLGMLEKAENAVRRALEIAEKSYGPDHPNVATSMSNLAQLLKETNRLDDAEPLMRRALEITEKSCGPDHPEVAISLNHLSSLLFATNRLKDAEPLMRRALEIDEKSCGPDHPMVAILLNNLAFLLYAMNRLKEAEPLMRRALNIDKKSYGPNHPKVAIRLSNLVSFLLSTNRLKEAEPLMHRAFKIFKEFSKKTGHEHPNMQTVIENHRSLLEQMGLSKDEIERRLETFE